MTGSWNPTPFQARVLRRDRLAGMIREYAQVTQGGSVSGTCKLDDEPRLGTELDVR
jgi:hypothetical protein